MTVADMPPASAASSTKVHSAYYSLARYLQDDWQHHRPQPLPLHIRCGQRRQSLLVLAEHPKGVAMRSAVILPLLIEALRRTPSELREALMALDKLDANLRAEIFLRVQGERKPYAGKKCYLSEWKPSMMPGPSDSSHSAITANVSTMPDAEGWTAELFAPAANSSQDNSNAVNPTTTSSTCSHGTASQSSDFRPLPWIAAGVGICTATFVGAYLLVSRPCLIAPCTPLTDAEQLATTAQQALPAAQNWEDVKIIEEQLMTAIESLNQVPRFSKYWQQSEQQRSQYQTLIEALKPISEAFSQAVNAAAKTQDLPLPPSIWWEAQTIWQQAIVQLTAIPESHPTYDLAQRKLSQYQGYLESVQQGLRREQAAERMLENAESSAKLATLQQQKATRLEDWKAAETHLLTAISALDAIAPQTTSYVEAQNRLQDYREQVAAIAKLENQEQFAANLYDQAQQQAQDARVAEKAEDWQTARNRWQAAVDSLGKVPKETSSSAQAQSLMQEYNLALQAATLQHQSLDITQIARQDLSQACSGQPAVCSFRVTPSLITVQLTFEYEQTVLAVGTLGNAQQQSETLQQLEQLEETLTTISDRAAIPLELYDPDGSLVGAHIP